VSGRTAAQEDEGGEAIRELAELQEQTRAARADLARVQHEVIEAEELLASAQTTHMLEANEQLIESTLRAHAQVETCTEALHEASRSSQVDPLTELSSRALLLDRLEQVLAGAKRHPNVFALLFVDLDGFKQVNDSLGHAAGDQVLRLAAHCFKSSVRETDTVCRYGGDEFVILLPDVSDGHEAGLIAGKLIAALAACREPDAARGLTASIGISVYPDDGDDAQALIDRADAAMYRAKERGPGGFVLYGQPQEGGSPTH
jgi:diguanylate cyclase (GGDEF)-like protein